MIIHYIVYLMMAALAAALAVDAASKPVARSPREGDDPAVEQETSDTLRE